MDDSNGHAIPGKCPAWVQRLLGCALILHLICLVAEPLCYFSRSETRGISPEFLGVRRLFAPYVEVLYLDHGYFFFAPNPGPSHLIEYSIAPQESVRRIPDRTRQWPRLLYHRYFMLSEFYDQSFVPSSISAEEQKDPAIAAQWRTERNRYEQIQASLRKSLEYSEGSPVSELVRKERLPPDEYQFFVEHWPIDDPRLLRTLPEGMAVIPTIPEPLVPPPSATSPTPVRSNEPPRERLP